MAADKIATEPLYIGYARAFSPGDVVPEEHIKTYDWSDKVTSSGTKAAQEAKVAGTSDGPSAPPGK
jgi:hypothetical protein